MTALEADQAPGRQRTWTALAPVLLAPVAAAITLSITLVDHSTVVARSGLVYIGFGVPLVWLKQDQSSLDPSFPMNATFISHWGFPASVSVVPLLLDVLVVYALLLAGLLVFGRIGRSFSR